MDHRGSCRSSGGPPQFRIFHSIFLSMDSMCLLYDKAPSLPLWVHLQKPLGTHLQCPGVRRALTSSDMMYCSCPGEGMDVVLIAWD